MIYGATPSTSGKSTREWPNITGEYSDEKERFPFYVNNVLTFCIIVALATISGAGIIAALLDNSPGADITTYGENGHSQPIAQGAEDLPYSKGRQDLPVLQALPVGRRKIPRTKKTAPRFPFTIRPRTRWIPSTKVEDKPFKTKSSFETAEWGPSTTSKTTAAYKPLNQRLFCAYGSKTTANTKFPEDGLCDFIFYDSMYKNDYNTLTRGRGYGPDLQAVLKEATSGGNKKKTEFGLGFTCERLHTLLDVYANTVNNLLTPFIKRGILHFGVIDCPVYGFSAIEMDQVFAALGQLDRDVRPLRNRGKPAYMVIGAVSFSSTWNDYFKRTFRKPSVFKPHLFISHGYQMEEDWQRTPCIVTPPTLLDKPSQPEQNIHDLRDAVRALAELNAEVEAPHLSLSVTMKGRWSELLANTPSKVFSPCSQWPPHRPSASYTAVCNTAPFSNNLAYDRKGYAMRAFDLNTSHMFVYDSEGSLCEKLCKVKADHTQLQFGLAVFDLEYEDGENVCSGKNTFGSFSRLKMVAKLLEFFISQYKDRTEEATCSNLWIP